MSIPDVTYSSRMGADGERANVVRGSTVTVSPSSFFRRLTRRFDAASESLCASILPNKIDGCSLFYRRSQLKSIPVG
jgi:hypothetical protein